MVQSFPVVMQSGPLASVLQLVLGGVRCLSRVTPRRFIDEIDWQAQYWHMVLGGSASLVLGLHNCGKFNGRGAKATIMSRSQVSRLRGPVARWFAPPDEVVWLIESD